MKRVGSLFWRVTAFENLCEAARLAQRSKRFRKVTLIRGNLRRSVTPQVILGNC